MARINKSVGSTTSERFLARLADKSFLSLWSYPNVFRDKGKELCDLLVVCGNHVLVFSDKSIEWPDVEDENLAWSRWYRRAVQKSSAQLARAIGWIRNHPNRLFLDAQCVESFPIDLPSREDMQIHGIIVARGAAVACMKNFGSGSGSLGLMPLACRSRNKQDVPSVKFFIGNPSPSDAELYHVLDDVTLGVLLRELDTITDFCDYLCKKSKLILGDHLLSAHGEEDLLATYLKELNENGEHDFVVTPGKAISGNQAVIIDGGSYDLLRRRGEYKRKKSADRISYTWDRLIESFAKNIIADTSYTVDGFERHAEPRTREIGLRHMALVSRLERRTHSLAIKGAFDLIGKRDRYFRAMLPGAKYVDRSTGFFILLVKRDTFLKDYADEEYRRFRANLALGYAMNLLRHVPYLKRVVGIATEGELSRDLRSEDLIYAEEPEWTEATIAETEAMATGMEIFKNGPPTGDAGFQIRPFEYPPSHYQSGGGSRVPYQYVHEPEKKENRKERRAAKSKSRQRR